MKLNGDVTTKGTLSTAAAQVSDQSKSSGNSVIIFSSIAVSIVVSLVAIGFLLYRHGLNKGHRDVSNQESLHKLNSNLDTTVDLSFFQEFDGPTKAKEPTPRSISGNSSLRNNGRPTVSQANLGGNPVSFPVRESQVMYAADMNDEMSQALSDFISVSKHPASLKGRNRSNSKNIGISSPRLSQTHHK